MSALASTVLSGLVGGASAAPSTELPGGTSRQARRGRRRVYEVCIFLIATVMLLSAAVSTYMIVRTQPALVAPVGKVFSRMELRSLKDWVCEKGANSTALQKFLKAHHTTLAPGDVRDVPHHPETLSRDNAAAAARAACACDCTPNVAAALAGRPCHTDCSSCGGAASGSAGEGSSSGGSVAAALASGNLRSLAGSELLEAVGRDLRSRFTDAACYLHGDESELCAFAGAVCYDGQNVVFSVPQPPAPHKQDPNGYGLVLGDPTGACFDYRYYEPTAMEYTTCKYDLFKFQRQQRYTTQPYPSQGLSPSHKPAKLPKGVSPSSTGTRTGSPSQLPLKPEFKHKSDWTLPLNLRRWGPLNRGAVRFREVQDTVIFGPRPGGLDWGADGSVVVRDAASAGRAISNGQRGALRPGTYFKGFDKAADSVYKNLTGMGINIVSVARYTPPSAPSQGKNKSTAGGPITVYWTDRSLWFTAMDAQFDRHIYHATTRLMALYHAQRQNRSSWGDNEADGTLPPLDARNHPLENVFMRWLRHSIGVQDGAVMDALRLAGVASKYGGKEAASNMAVVRPNRQQFFTSAGWDLPPQDYVIITGPSANFASTDKMIAFLKGVTELVAQPQTKWYTNPHMSILSPNASMLCARRGVVTGTHPRLFVNRADAWMFRRNAYEYANVASLGLQPHPHHPPRKITVLLRKGKAGRNFENVQDVMRVINATGLPVEYIEDMGRLSFKQQIARMAGTGILIAAHGAALVNSMFLPQHAVVIEIFPWKFKKATYINLAALLGLWHLPIYTGSPNMTDMSFYGIRMAYQNSSTGQNFFDGCVKANVSSVDALLHFRCNAVSKALPILVPLGKLKDALDEALDITAAYSGFNDQWAGQLDALQGKVSPSRKPAPVKAQQAGKGKNATAGKGEKPAPSPKRTPSTSKTAPTHHAGGNASQGQGAVQPSRSASKSAKTKTANRSPSLKAAAGAAAVPEVIGRGDDPTAQGDTSQKDVPELLQGDLGGGAGPPPAPKEAQQQPEGDEREGGMIAR